MTTQVTTQEARPLHLVACSAEQLMMLHRLRDIPICRNSMGGVGAPARASSAWATAYMMINPTFG
jgi:hypothetical protein